MDNSFKEFSHKTIKERVFKKPTKIPNVDIVVYTSIVGLETRSSGKDAIRVCLLYTDTDNNIVPLSKERRVHRTGQIPDIVHRITERITSVNSSVDSIQLCKDCGAPTKEFKSKRTGNKFTACANFCLKKGITKKKLITNKLN